MSNITCQICGVKKGATNKWLVLFEADSSRAVILGPIDMAETLSHWQSGMTRVHICGAECLYRKLNGILHPVAVGEKAQRVTATAVAPQNGSNAAVPISDGSSSRWNPPKYSNPEPASYSTDLASSRFDKGLSRLRQSAAIQQGITINGHIQSGESLYLNGDLTGTVALPDHRLTVGPSGKIRASVHAREVEVLGVIEGDVQADKILVRKNATLLGNISTLALVIEEGAFFEGQCSRKLARVP
jgi:cytoskeletal protein CcmA (bactofilin family)